MSITFEKPSLWRRVLPLLRGFDLLLLTAVLLLAGAGLLAMYSSGYDLGNRFGDHGRYMLAAAGIMFVTAQIPPQRLMSLAVPAYTLGVALLVAVALFGITRKGATRWLNVGMVIQPSELLKIATPMMLAWWFHRREGARTRASDFIVAFIILALPAGLIVKQPDLGTALLVVVAGLAVIFFAGLPWKLVLPPVLLLVVGIVVLLVYENQLCADGVDWHVLREYQRQRVCTLLDPTRDPLNKGFHTLQGMIAIGSGGLRGKGFMQGTQTHLEFIPEHTTDFIFASFSEEFGLIGNLALMLGFIFLILRALTIAADGPTLFARLLSAALATTFFAYAFVNMGMVSGILPVVGVPLPFISYGGTAMLTLGFALGILMSISRAKWLMKR
ncbi:MAG: rod shape-determining protein RodA [Burkholderiaceae bacterium]|nr:rod shape-determining protein RodA [Burkholderiaceae bacterium]